MKLLFLTRFSFYGKSGWASSTSTDPDQLLAPERLDFRLKLFEEVTLASLKVQTDPDFKLVVLTSSLMNPEYRTRLKSLVYDTLGDRARVMFKPYRSANLIFSNLFRNAYSDQEYIAHSVLDDDDALSVDFVEHCRYEAQSVVAHPSNNDRFTFLSFPRGYTIGFENGQASWLSPRYVPFTNLGLTMVASPRVRKTVFGTSHLKVGQRHPSRLIGSRRPYYLRAVHDFNDSRGNASDEYLSSEQITKTFEYFPFLQNHFTDTALIAAE